MKVKTLLTKVSHGFLPLLKPTVLYEINIDAAPDIISRNYVTNLPGLEG
jgi:hypothetical protein